MSLGWRISGVRWFAWAAFVGCVAQMSFAEQLVIATYNVRNYNATDRRIEDGWRPDYPKPESEKAALRTVLRRIDADIVVLQEMGPMPYLVELQRDLKTEGLDYPHMAWMLGVDEQRHLAVLSKRVFTRVQPHDDLTFAYSGGSVGVRRGLLEVRVQTSVGELTIFDLHLKSRLTEHKEDPEGALWRKGEAEVIRDRVLTVFPEPEMARFLIMGDANDTRTARPLRALLSRGKTEIARWVPALDSRGHAWTLKFERDESYFRYDHVLSSPGLWPTIVQNKTRIEDGLGVGEASDHRPIVVTLDL